MDIDGKRLSELPLTYRFADDGTIIISSATEGSKRIDLATFIELISGGGAGSADLADLGDVVINSPADKQILQYDAQFGKWTNRTQEAGNQTLNELSDVNITQVQDKQVLGYDNATHRWKNMQAASSVDTLTDVNLNNLSDKQILKYNNTTHKWENVDLEGGTAIYYLDSDQDLPTGNDIEDAFYIVTENQSVPKIVYQDSEGLDANELLYSWDGSSTSWDAGYMIGSTNNDGDTLTYTTKPQYNISYEREVEVSNSTRTATDTTTIIEKRYVTQIVFINNNDPSPKLNTRSNSIKAAPEVLSDSTPYTIIVTYYTTNPSSTLTEDVTDEFYEGDDE